MPYKDKDKQKRYLAENYQQNSEKYQAQRRERFEINRRFIIQYLEEHPCIVCGEDDILVLDFDHRNPMDKSRNINKAVKQFGPVRLKEEIDKCDILCSNCHRRKTAKQLNNYKLRFK
jgi:5-methylcytosine-specific restriction endonuclease McrA